MAKFSTVLGQSVAEAHSFACRTYFGGFYFFYLFFIIMTGIFLLN